MATNREYINAILFSGMLDALPPPQMNNFLKKVSEHIPKYVYKYQKVVGNPPTAANTQIVVTKRYELEKISKYTALHCIESQMRAVEHLPKCKALPLVKDAIDRFEKEHEGGDDDCSNMQQTVLDQIVGCSRFTEMLNSDAAKKIVPVKPQSGEADLAKVLRDINSQNPWETATRFSRGEK